MRYGFLPNGTFVVASDAERLGSFAFDTSPHADAAKKDPARIAKEMIDQARRNDDLGIVPRPITNQHYDLSCKDLESIGQ